MPQQESRLRLLHELVPLIHKLARQEPALERWLRSSEANADWFCRDPFAALRAAKLGIEEELLKELESATHSIRHRLEEDC